jgi:hypothetical protein
MAKVALAGGVEIDLATKDDVERAVRDRQCLELRVRKLAKTATVPAGASALWIPIAGPTDPVVWDVRSLTLVGSDDHTPVANVQAAVYVGQGQGPNLPDLVWTGLTVPSSTRWSAQVVGLHHENLSLNLTGSGLTAGQSFLVVATVIEVPADQAPLYFA